MIILVLFGCCSQWKRFLQFSRKEVVQGACKWWFHLYGLCRDQSTQTGFSQFYHLSELDPTALAIIVIDLYKLWLIKELCVQLAKVVKLILGI